MALNMWASVIAALVLCAAVSCARPLTVAAGGLKQLTVADQYNVTLGQHYVNMSFAAYCSKEKIEHWSCNKFCGDKRFHFVGLFKDWLTEADGFVGYDEELGEAVVSFRGSDNLPNWIDDFDFIKVDFNGTSARVHQGFYVAWQRMSDQIKGLADKALAMSSATNKRVTCTGHSLGAAISGFCAIELAAYYSDRSVQVHMHNFGMPRIGDKDFSDIFGQRVASHFRVVDHHDIVPHVPFIDFGFHHVATEVWDMTSRKTPFSEHQIKVCDGSGEDKSCSDSVGAFEWSVDDHLYYLGIDISGC